MTDYDRWKAAVVDDPPTCEACGEFLTYPWPPGPMFCAWCADDDAAREAQAAAQPDGPHLIEQAPPPTEWTDLPKEVLDDMEWLGHFGPTVKPENRVLKGSMACGDGDVGKAYLGAGDARRLAKSLNAAADWLDARANAAKGSP